MSSLGVPVRFVEHLVKRNRELTEQLELAQAQLKRLELERSTHADVTVSPPTPPSFPSTPQDGGDNDSNNDNSNNKNRTSVRFETSDDVTATKTPEVDSSSKDQSAASDSSEEQVHERILDAARAIAEQKLKPAGERADLALQTKLGTALRRDNAEVVVKLLGEDSRLQTMRHVETGNTVLHLAAQIGAEKVIEAICDLPEVDVLATNLVGETALHVAAENLRVQACKVLKEKVIELTGSEPVGHNAPLDLAGLTPAGRSAIKYPKTADGAARKNMCTNLLHQLGDSCISPSLEHTRSQSKRRQLLATGNGTRRSWTAIKSVQRSVARRALLRQPSSADGRQAQTSGPRAVDRGQSITEVKVDADLLPHGHFTMPGFRVRSEDAVITNAELHPASFAVLDGHGGRGAADYCAEHLDHIFRSDEDVRRQLVEKDTTALCAAMKRAVLRVDEAMSRLPDFEVRRKILAEACGDEPAKVKLEARDKSGTTLVWATVTDSTIVVANVGDSRAVVSRDGGTYVVVMSRDHKVQFSEPTAESPFELMNQAQVHATLIDGDSGAFLSPVNDWDELLVADRRRVSMAGGEILDTGYIVPVKKDTSERLGMTRSLGNFTGKQNETVDASGQAVSAVPEFAVLERTPTDDFVLLACDGVWDVISNKKAVSFVHEQLAAGATDLDEVCRSLCVHCLHLGSQDNITAVLVDLRNRPGASGRGGASGDGGDRRNSTNNSEINNNNDTNNEAMLAGRSIRMTKRSILAALDNAAVEPSETESNSPPDSSKSPPPLDTSQSEASVDFQSDQDQHDDDDDDDDDEIEQQHDTSTIPSEMFQSISLGETDASDSTTTSNAPASTARGLFI